jgi:hydroxyacylglutathione hydrolase
MEELGGVGHMLLCHWHEASRSVRTIKQRFAASILSHARDAPPIEKESGVEPDLTFWDRQMLLGDIEAIPTPGHTVGSACYQYRSPHGKNYACYQYRSPHGKNYLFTGDTIWPARGSWTSVTFEDDAKQSSHRASLDLLATLEPDVVLSAIAPGDTFQEIAPSKWPAATAAAKARLG